MSGWYVVQTRPHAEERAVAHLKRQGFEVYLPKFEKRRRHARRVEVVKSPLFPRYLFVAVDASSQRWRAIASTCGVSRMVTFGSQPALMDGEVVAALKRREDDGGMVVLKPQVFVSGEAVRVKVGALADCMGLVEGMRDEERVCVLIDLLGRKVRVTLDQLELEAA